MTHVFPLLSERELAEVRGLLAAAPWTPGQITAGEQAAKVKNNEHADAAHDSVRAAQQIVVRALDRSPDFLSIALPARLYPPKFNRYGGDANAFGPHVDGSIRFTDTGQRVRSDLSCTVFISDPETYDGGELRVSSGASEARIKLAAGRAVLYPGNTVHEVTPVRRGERLACFFWVQSLVRSNEQRDLLLTFDRALTALRAAHGDDESTVAMTATYHNLLRMWAET